MFANETDRLIIFDDCGGIRLAEKDWNVKPAGWIGTSEQNSRFSIASAAVRKWLRKLELWKQKRRDGESCQRYAWRGKRAWRNRACYHLQLYKHRRCFDL